MLKLENISKTFLAGTPNEHRALKGLSLHLKPGEFYTVIGSNGAGKSTLFNAIAGNFWLEEGRVYLDGEDITFRKEHRRASVIGRMFQDPLRGTAPDLTIEENLSLAYSRGKRGPFSKALRKADTALFRETLARLDMGLEDRMDTRIGLLSGGQRQAVTLLMSTLATPKLLLLDEHTAALDPISAEKILGMTREIVEKNGITTLMITHNISQALALGTHTLMMDDGQVAFVLSGEERRRMTVAKLMEMYAQRSEKTLDNDRMLFS